MGIVCTQIFDGLFVCCDENLNFFEILHSVRLCILLKVFLIAIKDRVKAGAAAASHCVWSVASFKHNLAEGLSSSKRCCQTRLGLVTVFGDRSGLDKLIICIFRWSVAASMLEHRTRFRLVVLDGALHAVSGEVLPRTHFRLL